MERSTNALAELAKRLRKGIYIDKSDKRFGGPVICASLDANDVLKAQRIVAELAKIEEPVNRSKVKPGIDGMVHFADILKADEERCFEVLRNCRAIAEEGAGDEGK